MQKKREKPARDKGRYRFLVTLLVVFMITSFTTFTIFARAMGLAGAGPKKAEAPYELVEVSGEDKAKLAFYQNQ